VTFRSSKTFVPVALLAAAIAATAASPQQISKAVKVVQLTGLPGMKEENRRHLVFLLYQPEWETGSPILTVETDAGSGRDAPQGERRTR
jgi:hypothetical protein